MIYTGYFANCGCYRGCLLSIALITPDFFKGNTFHAFVPPSGLLNAYKGGIINEMEYTERYKAEVLDRLDKRKIYDYLTAIDKDEDVFLICYEKDGFCHRHIVADWLETEVGLRVDEYETQCDVVR